MTRTLPVFVAMLLTARIAFAADLPSPIGLTWHSAATETDLNGQIYVPPVVSQKPLPLVVYQENLNVPRLGQEADESIIADLLKAGHEVLVLDYAKHEKAKSPTINADYLAFRNALHGKKPALTLPGAKIDENQIYFVIEGYRLAHVDFGKTPKRTLGMDVFYPSKPSRPVPLLIEYTCDNQDRMGSSSLLFCHDTLVEGGQAAGFATAMVDHPVDPPYKGFDDPMPEVYDRSKASVAAARKFARENGLADIIGVIGFSRGGPIAAMLAVNGPYVSPGETKAESSSSEYDVQAALIHGNRYDYLDLLPDDRRLDQFKKKWGDPTTQPTSWAIHSATYYIKDPKKIAPMFLNTSRAEEVAYQDGLAKFDKKLTELGVDHVYQVDDDKRGHQVTTDPATLTKIYDFFNQHLKDTPK